LPAKKENGQRCVQTSVVILGTILGNLFVYSSTTVSVANLDEREKERETINKLSASLPYVDQ